jgi:hypothetical protein
MAKKRQHDDTSSLTDLMAGLAAIFLLIAVVLILKAARPEAREVTERQRFESQIEELRRFRERVLASLDALGEALRADTDLMEFVSMDDAARKRDPFLFLIVFNRNRLSFPRGECMLGPPQAELVSFAAPRVLGHVCSFVKGLEADPQKAGRATVTLTLEGHTDQAPFFPGTPGCGVDRPTCLTSSESPACQQVGFENNVRLSAARAQSVFFAMQRAVSQDAELSACLERYFVVAGRGPVEPANGQPWHGVQAPEEKEQNRRVVLKIRAQPSMDAIASDAPGSRP